MGQGNFDSDLLKGESPAAGLKLAIVVSRFNREITTSLTKGALAAIKDLGAECIKVYEVSGALEIPLLVKLLAKKVDAVVALGCVIRGETAHFDYVCMGMTQGLTQVNLEQEIPVGNGVLTCENQEQALERAQDNSSNKGYEAALAAIEMALIKKGFS